MISQRIRPLFCLLLPLAYLIALAQHADAADETQIIYIHEADSDANGIPDDPFRVLSDESLIWLAEIRSPDTGLQRTVAAMRIEAGRTPGESASLDIEVLRTDGSLQQIALEIPRGILDPANPPSSSSQSHPTPSRCLAHAMHNSSLQNRAACSSPAANTSRSASSSAPTTAPPTPNSPTTASKATPSPYPCTTSCSTPPPCPSSTHTPPT